jgi:hypothetical protein
MSNLSPRYELFSRGIFIDPMTEVSDLKALAHRLRPRKSQFDLVRIGGDSDGGYLVPNDLKGIKACFSPGVDQIASFETDIYRLGIPSHLADASVQAPPPGTPFKSFTAKFLAAHTECTLVSLEDWVNDCEPGATTNSLLLQMDIEGAEYETLLACPLETLKKFRIMIVEFHNIESWGQKEYFKVVQSLMRKILSEFGVVHSHPNNATGIVNMNGFMAPRVFEVTFLQKTRSAFGDYSQVPNELDRPNIPWAPDLTFPADWLT